MKALAFNVAWRRILSGFLALIALISVANAQSKVPSFAILPSEAWCVAHNYLLPGTEYLDLKAALNDKEFALLQAQITDLLVQCNVPVVDLSAAMEAASDEFAPTQAADIFIIADWTSQQTGMMKQFFFTINAVTQDGKIISAQQQANAPTRIDKFSFQVSEAVGSTSGKLISDIARYFESLKAVQ